LFSREVGGYFVPECHICGLEVPKEDGYYCSDCGEFVIHVDMAISVNSV